MHRQRHNKYRSQTQNSNDLNKSHIVQDNLNRKTDLLNKYQTQIQDLMEQIDSKQHYRKASNFEGLGIKKKRALSSLKKDAPHNDLQITTGSMKEYQKLILGLQYSLQTERKKNEQLTIQNASLQSQISNLRNLLMGPDEQKSYEKTAFKEAQQKITYLENRIIEQKKNNDFILDAKNQYIATLQNELKALKKGLSGDEKDKDKDKGAMSKKVLQLTNLIDEMKHSMTKKNIQIQRLKYYNAQEAGDSDDDEVTKIRKVERIKFYLQQLEISNKLILRKNIQILALSTRVINYEKILDVIQLYLDKKQVKGIDLSLLEHVCVNKLRILLREKALFQKELLAQLNQHNKKISLFENQIVGRDKNANDKFVQIVNDNKRLAGTVGNLQSNIAQLQKELDDQKKQNQLLSNQITINKRQFVQEISRLKEEMQKISSVTKNEFDRMKIENLKLTQQNRSLLFLVGQKEREIHKKGQAIKTFQQYKEKINTLDVGDRQKRKIENVGEDQPQIGSKLLLINNFSNWLFEWNKIKNWNNKKTLLNLILDKQQIRGDALNSMGYLINVLHESILNSKNVQIQERGTLLLAYFIPHNILKNQSLYLNKITPIAVRSFRPIIQGEDETKHKMLNEAALRLTNQLQKDNYQWTIQMTNQMLSVNGLKYLFNIINKSRVDDYIQFAYNTLILIARQNEMISFMQSFNINNLIYDNLKVQYNFIIYILTLVKALLGSSQYIRSQQSLVQYRKLFDLLAVDDDEQLIDLVLDNILTLIDKSSFFTKNLNKISCISILSQLIRTNHQSYDILKKAGKVFVTLISDLQTQHIPKFYKQELPKLLQIIGMKKFNENRFNRAIRIVNKITPIIVDYTEFDERVLSSFIDLFASYQLIQVQTRSKINSALKVIYERNKEVVSKYTNDTVISNLVQAYKMSNYHQQITFLLMMLIFQTQQKRTTQILRSGRQTLLNKLIADAMVADYNVTINSLKLLLAIVKEKYSQKFITKNFVSQLVNKVLNERSQQEYIGITLSILYFLCKVDTVSTLAVESNIVNRVCNVIVERHEKQQIVFKCFAVLQVCHTNNYKKKVLNYLLANDNNLQILKTISFILRKAKNKVQIGSRAVFIYDFLNGKSPLQSLAILTQRNTWMIEDLVLLRNQYVGKVDSLVYKIQMLLHQMSNKSNKIKKLYQRFKVEGAGSEDDD